MQVAPHIALILSLTRTAHKDRLRSMVLREVEAGSQVVDMVVVAAAMVNLNPHPTQTRNCGNGLLQ